MFNTCQHVYDNINGVYDNVIVTYNSENIFIKESYSQTVVYTP